MSFWKDKKKLIQMKSWLYYYEIDERMHQCINDVGRANSCKRITNRQAIAGALATTSQVIIPNDTVVSRIFA
jgi:hypothetical protein